MPANLKQSTLIAVAAVCAGAAIGWAGLEVFRPQTAVSPQSHTYVEVTNGDVGSSIALNAVGQWGARPIGTNQATGIVTSVPVGPGTSVSSGDTLFTVNLRPVVIAAGEVPAFRELAVGTSGEDVEQLQQMLAAQGLFSGVASGEFADATEAAVRVWQAGLGVEADGRVTVGDVIFVQAKLPLRISVDQSVVARGQALAGGEQVLSALTATPSFSMPVTEAQSAQMPPGTRVEIEGPDGAVWQAVTTEATLDPETSEVTVGLASGSQRPICAPRCASVPVRGMTRLSSTVVTLETASGAVVPTAALSTLADGTVAVVDRAGRRHEVKVVATARGQSVVEGVSSGLTVRLPAENS